MNPWQMAQQLKAELEAATWPEDSAELVFGAQGQTVACIAGDPTPEQFPQSYPWCLVSSGGYRSDEDDPELLIQSFRLITAVAVGGDPMGEQSVIGGATPVASSEHDLGQSQGRGILELMERVAAIVEDLDKAQGVPIRVLSGSSGATSPFGRGRHISFAELTLEALCTRQLYYTPTQLLARSGSSWTWNGSICSDRFDFLQYRLGRITGSSPVETPAEADAIEYTGTTAAATVAPTSGTHTYMVWADYNARGASNVEGSSDGRTVGCYLTVSA